MLLIFLILVVIVFVIFYLSSRFNADRLHLSDMVVIGDTVLERAGYSLPNYMINESTNGESRTIFSGDDLPLVEIQTLNPDGEYYDRETLIMVYLHEMVHVLFPNESHTSAFYDHEDRLIQAAIDLKYISEDTIVDSQYPHHTH